MTQWTASPRIMMPGISVSLALEAVGKFRSDTEDVSERHDEYLVQAFQG